ncbi:VOC family protein [Baekduia soli]|uniref:VOC family protein n=1 Tax=Baekduia soli TaxID=496014 RepID=A0A5B8UC46_9ACTN|nr:VOC family protein [Baekduia soli]QEC50567.1 VOC family protein [Baekduia soli]
MPTDQLHHSGMLVADIERSAAFYIEALDARYLFRPAVNEGAGAQYVLGGDDDVAFTFCYLGFRTGAVEIMQFLSGAPDWAKDPVRGRLPHFALVVDDVDETTRRVVAAGGSTLWPEPIDWGGAKVMYVADPDGNPIELFDVGLEEIVSRTLDLFPASAP